MTVLTAAEDGTVDTGVVGDVDGGILDIRLLVEEDARVALAAAEQVARHGMVGNLRQRARHAQRSADHRHIAVAFDVGHLVAAIYTGQDMTAGNRQIGVTLHLAGGPQPLALAIGIHVGEVTAAAAEHIAVERMAVAARRPAALGRFTVGISAV